MKSFGAPAEEKSNFVVYRQHHTDGDDETHSESKKSFIAGARKEREKHVRRE